MEAGTILKHYRIVSRLGEGGMGVVYRAEDTRLGRTVALKVLPESLSGNEDNVRRFEREARAASAVTHPGIATLYDFDRHDDTAFLTMEFVEGRTLKQLLEDGPLALDQLVDCLSQVAEGLAAAHRKGIVHRDLKPENVMASESGFYKILDFGLARMEMPDALSRSGDPTQVETVLAGVTSQGMVVGTFAYMSPEQAQAEPVDARSDVFSFGVLLHELATGQSPFRRKNAISTFHAIVHEEPEPMSSYREDVPAELERIAAKCLEKDPADRYQSAVDLAVDLRHLRRGSGATGQAAVAAPSRAPRSARRGRAWRIGLPLAVAGGAALVTLLLLLMRQPAPPEPAPPSLPGGGDAAQPAAAPSARNRIAISPFANQTGDPESAWLSKGVPDLLTTDLARVPGLEIISTERLRDLMAAAGREQPEDLDARTVTQLARWAGAGIVIGGSIYRVGDVLRVDAQAYDTRDGQVLAASRAEGAEVFSLVDRIAEELLGTLELASGERSGAHARLTASPEAYRRYSRGMELQEELRFADAAAAFAEALEFDPGFALAGLRRGMSLHLAGETEAGLGLIRASLEGADGLPERERMLARGILIAFGDGGSAAGQEILAAMEEIYPRDTESRLWHARVRAELDQDPMGAIRTLREGMDLDPNNVLAVAGMVELLRSLSLTREADGILADFLQRNPDAPADRMRAPGVFASPAS